jgi:hypothetical protein
MRPRRWTDVLVPTPDSGCPPRRTGHQATAASERQVGERGWWCRMDPGPTTLVGTKTDYSVGPWDYSTCATQHPLARSARTTEE